MSKKLLRKLLLGSSIMLNSCVTTSYTKNLENIVKQSHQTISLRQEQIQQHKLEQEQIPFTYSETQLSVSKNRKINLEIYNSENAFSNIILLPTLGEPASSLDKFSKEMASYGHNVFALDIEGFGKSTGKRGKINIPKIKQDISTTIEHIKSQNNKKIVLAGTSIGSEFSLIYLSEGKYKQEIDASIFHGLFAPNLDIPAFDYRLMFLQTDIGACLTTLFSGGELNMLYHLGKENFYNDEQGLKEILDDQDYLITKINTRGYTEFIHYKPKTSISSYKGGVLFIISKDDKIVPNTILYIPSGRDLNNEVPHMAFDTNYNEITQTINHFLRGVLK